MRHPPSYRSKLGGGGGGRSYLGGGGDLVGGGLAGGSRGEWAGGSRGGGLEGLRGGQLEGVGGGVRPWGGGDTQGGGAYTRPTTTTCIPRGEMCVWGGFGEVARGCCEAGAGVSTVVVVIFTSQQTAII